MLGHQGYPNLKSWGGGLPRKHSLRTSSRQRIKETSMFDLDQFIADLRGTLAERSRQAMKEVVARAVSDPVSLYRAIGEPDKSGAQVLHHAPDLTVINLAWAPQQITLPHNHLL